MDYLSIMEKRPLYMIGRVLCLDTVDRIVVRKNIYMEEKEMTKITSRRTNTRYVPTKAIAVLRRISRNNSIEAF